MGGSDDPSNIELITVEEHAQRHYELWLSCDHWEDEIDSIPGSGTGKYRYIHKMIKENIFRWAEC
jgi:hypothetical protein